MHVWLNILHHNSIITIPFLNTIFDCACMCFFIVANNLAIATDYLFVLQLCVTDVLMYVVELRM